MEGLAGRIALRRNEHRLKSRAFAGGENLLRLWPEIA
jgi:hypothetical protein